MQRAIVDVVVVGGGPAGLSATLVLARCGRQVLLCDSGHSRNAASPHLNGFLTRDGTDPDLLRGLGRSELSKYDTVRTWDDEVVDAQRTESGFTVTLSDLTMVPTRKLLLATGVLDEVPQVEGFNMLYGQSAFHCPYCDGWEWRDQPLMIYGKGERGEGLALELTAWSEDLVLCTDGPSHLSMDDRVRLAANGIIVNEDPIARFESKHGLLQFVHFANGNKLERRAMFFSCGERQGSDLAAKLGCDFTPKGTVETAGFEKTQVPGLYVAGDAARSVQLSIIAAGHGAEAAFAINTELLKEDLK